jgi:hypothetical protein
MRQLGGMEEVPMLTGKEGSGYLAAFSSKE